jgi:hypothetical protein
MPESIPVLTNQEGDRECITAHTEATFCLRASPEPTRRLAGMNTYRYCVLSGTFCQHYSRTAALLFTPLLLAFLSLTAWMEKSWAVWWNQAIGFALGLGLSAFAWLPALAARQYASMNRAVEGNGKYSDHFVYLHQLFYSPWGYGLSVRGPDDGMSFALGWSQLLLAALA